MAYVDINTYDENGDATRLARVMWDGESIAFDPPKMAKRLSPIVVARSLGGKLTPADGRAFLDALPVAYSGSRVRASAVQE